MNLDYLISLHPKKAILATFTGQTPHVQVKIQKPDLTTYTVGKLSMLRFFEPNIEDS